MTVSSAIHCSQLSTLTYATRPKPGNAARLFWWTRECVELTLPAFLLSVTGSSSLSLQLLPARFHSSAGINDSVFINAYVLRQATSGAVVPDAFKQMVWDNPLVAVNSDDVLQAAQTQVGRARLIAAAVPHAGDNLNALQCSDVGTHLDETSLRIAVALRLGTEVCAPYSCMCGHLVDRWPMVCMASRAAYQPVVTCATMPSTT
jgi:hypothetical protein